MPPWAIKKKQKTEEKLVITKDFVDKNLCISLLDTFFKNYNIMLLKIDKGDESEVIFNRDSRIITHLYNQVLIAIEIDIDKTSSAQNINISQIAPFQRYYINFHNTSIEASLHLEKNFNNLFIIYKLNTQTTGLFSMANNHVPYAQAAQQITFLGGSLLIGGLLMII